jgi:prepilin-type processing-associated H-X9-DG protein
MMKIEQKESDHFCSSAVFRFPGHPRRDFHPRHGSRNALTLMELLVIIAVLGVLIALLFPAISQIKLASGNAKCLSNLRQIGMGFRGYIDEHDGFAPPHWGVPFFDPATSQRNLLWTGWIAPYLGESNATTGSLTSIFDCPNDPDSRHRPKNRGYKSTADNWMISYGYNYLTMTSQMGWGTPAPNLRAVSNCTKLILAADSVPLSSGGTLIALVDLVNRGSASTGGPGLRHQGRFNSVFLDGHTEGLGAEVLTDTKYCRPQY